MDRDLIERSLLVCLIVSLCAFSVYETILNFDWWSGFIAVELASMGLAFSSIVIASRYKKIDTDTFGNIMLLSATIPAMVYISIAIVFNISDLILASILLLINISSWLLLTIEAMKVE